MKKNAKRFLSGGKAIKTGKSQNTNSVCPRILMRRGKQA